MSGPGNILIFRYLMNPYIITVPQKKKDNLTNLEVLSVGDSGSV